MYATIKAKTPIIYLFSSKGGLHRIMKGKSMKILLHWRKNWISLPGRKYIQTMMNCRAVEDMNWTNSWFSETGDMLIMKVIILNPVQNRNSILSWLQPSAVIRLSVRSVLCGISTLQPGRRLSC